MSFDFLDKNFFKDNWDEFVHQKIFEQVTTINSQSASTANSLASQAESHALSAGELASQAESHALSAGNLASQADSHALSAGNLASQADSHALSAGVVASTANSLASQAESHALSAGSVASQADSHALSVVSYASDALSIANSAASVASQANSTANNNTALINKNTQAILTNKNDINNLNNKQDSSANDLTSLASLASQADSIANNANTTANTANSKAASNTTAITNLTNNVNGWQTSANDLIHANSAAASNAQHIANSAASVASQANSTANNNTALISKNTQAILANKNDINDLMNTTGYSNPVDFNHFNKVANYTANFWGSKSWTNAPDNLPTAGWGTILVRVLDGYSALQQWIIANDTMQAWNRYQNPNSKAWTIWHYYDFNNNVNIQNFNDNHLLNGATGTISAQLTGNVVTLNLQAQHDTSNAVIYQLPAVLRPKANTQSAAVEFNNSTIYIDFANISTNGNLQIEQRKYDNTLLNNINVNTIFTYNLQ